MPSLPIRLAASGSLARHPDFRKVWLGETVSQFGGQITYLAIPLAAALLLGASPAEMGLLGAMGLLPYLLMSLPAGVLIDRSRRRPILVASSLAMAAGLLVVPAAYVAGVLSMPILYVVSLISGAGGLVYDVAAQAYLPTLIERRQLIEANGKLEISRSAAQVAGPGIGGVLVGLLTAPIAILVDSVALFAAGLMMTRIRSPEPAPAAPARRPSMIHEIHEGLRLVLRSSILRSIALTMATYFFFDQMVQSVYILFVTRDLGLTPGEVGLIYAIGNLGLIAGALLAGRIAARFGVGPTLMVAIFSSSCFGLLVPLAGSREYAIPLLILARLGMSFGIPVWMINQISLRQSITPDRLLGRLTATMKFVSIGVAPLGAVIGGILGSAIGVHAALVFAAVGSLTSVLWLIRSPVRDLHLAPRAWTPEEAFEAEFEAAAESPHTIPIT